MGTQSDGRHRDASHRDWFPAGQYFVGVAGMAAMRRVIARPAEGRPRLAEIRAVIEHWDEFPNDLRVDVAEHDVESGYTAWAPIYDGPNPLIAAEEPIVQGILAGLGASSALDAGCGTGRHARWLHEQGIDTIGVDATEAMLTVARSNAPDVDFRTGRMEAIPVDDESVDLVVSALAVCHVPDLVPVMSEFARVTRPGGSVVVSDPHPTGAQFGGVAAFRDPDADPTQGLTIPFVPNLPHPIHTYVNAAVGAGLRVVACHESPFPEDALAMNPAFAVYPDAVRQAFDGLPYLLVWHFEKPSE